MSAETEEKPHWATEILGVDLRSLAVLRICLGFILVFDLVLRARDMGAHYTDWGLLPRAGLLELGWEPAWISVHMASGHWLFQAFLFLFAGVCSAAVMVGYRTSLATFLAWLMLVSLQSRNPVILNGGDVMLRVVLFWCMFLPWGARWSVDARSNPSWEKLPQHVYSAATVAYLVQICLIYIFAALLKTGPHWRTEGTAVYYALSLDQFTRYIGKWLLHYPGLMKFLTYATWWFEALVPLMLVFPLLNGPLRTLGVLGITVMHLGFGACMHIGVFTMIASATAFGLLPAWFWDRLGALRWKAPGWLKGLHGPESLEPGGWRLGWPTSMALALLTVYVIVWNIGTMANARLRVPRSVRCVGIFLHLDQAWNMFAPYPLTEDGWYVIEAHLRNGEKVDLFRGGEKVTWDKPEWVSATYPNERWRKYMMNLWMRDYSRYRLYYGRYLCRSWNGSHPYDRQVTTFKIYFMLENTLPNYQTAPIEKVELWSHDCFRAD
ncbi:MAG: HTTM domain-containing protein [Candidatus Eremiobacterota bacterium]